MSVTVCPLAVIHAPAERVWTLLAEPANYDSWWEARTRSIVPEGRAQAGQRIQAKAGGLNLDVVVNRIDEAKRQIHVTTRFPFGITVSSHVTCTPLEEGVCQVSFG
jgi:uncharacterized protein YndB with AHSA1/START domain